MITGNFPCFLVEETEREFVWLRRYRNSSSATCSGNYGYCNAMAYFAMWDARLDAEGRRHPQPMVDHKNPRWPKTCEYCGYEFTADDQWQMFGDTIMRANDGREWPMRMLPTGAMWYPSWMQDPERSIHSPGPDGKVLQVICPDGTPWVIDSRANNCDRKDDDEHKCWVRHGVPPNVSVGKDGNTCGAGAGSILTHNYHGYLRNGSFVDA